MRGHLRSTLNPLCIALRQADDLVRDKLKLEITTLSSINLLLLRCSQWLYIVEVS